MKKKLRIAIDSGMVLLLPFVNGIFHGGRSNSRISRHRNVSVIYCPPYFKHCMVEKHISWTVYSTPHCGNDGQFCTCGHYAGSAGQRYDTVPACVPVSASWRFSDSQNGSPAGILLGTRIDEFSCRYAWPCDDGNDSKEYQNAASIETQNMELTNAYFVVSNLWHLCFS